MHYLFWCAFDHLSFRIPEFESICNLLRIEYSWVNKNDTHPWVILDLPSDKEALKILSRSISTKHCIQLWVQGESYDEFHNALKALPHSDYPALSDSSTTFKVNVETFMKKTSVKERIQLIETMDYLPIAGEVSLNNPGREFSYLEFWGLRPNEIRDQTPDNPFNIFFGLKIGEGQRHLITKQSIKTRKFIGNTTMDPQLSLLMANLGMVEEGRLVLDPFVGTGSLLLAAAEFKGFVFGGDIDYLTLHARSRPSRVTDKVRAVDESMEINFKEYGLSAWYGDVIVGDFSKPCWRTDLKFDAIISDPPYGIREAMNKVGSEKDFTNSSIPGEYLERHLPEKVEYSLENILVDLLNFSAERLSLGGRLVYWIPIIRQEYQEHLLPSHPGLRLVYNCEQMLTCHTSRRLIVMEKVSEVKGEAVVHGEITRFKDQYFIPLAGKINRKERKERIKKHGHLNISQEEMENLKKIRKPNKTGPPGAQN